MSEHDEQVALFAMAELHQERIPELKWMYAIPNGGHRHKVVAGKLKAEGVKSGVPDICLPISSEIVTNEDDEIPGFETYSALYIEMKIGRNKPTEKQQEWIDGLRSMGNYVEVCYSCDEAWAVIMDYLGIMEIV